MALTENPGLQFGREIARRQQEIMKQMWDKLVREKRDKLSPEERGEIAVVFFRNERDVTRVVEMIEESVPRVAHKT